MFVIITMIIIILLKYIRNFKIWKQLSLLKDNDSCILQNFTQHRMMSPCPRYEVSYDPMLKPNSCLYGHMPSDNLIDVKNYDSFNQ